jgi:hypothetical protein
LAVSGGPLIDFSRGNLPQWLWLWERDAQNLADFMCGYVEKTLERYHGQIPVWEITAASNWASLLALEEDELLWLTVRLLEVARQVDPQIQVSVGIAQPWGEYLASEDRAHSPFVFADTLLRSGIPLAALGLELVMGIWPRGSYWRDLLDTSRLLDLYALLGLPLRVSLGCPSAAAVDPLADPEFRVVSQTSRREWSADQQAAWASRLAALTACKPYVQAVDWIHLSDGEPHQFPHCGLVDRNQASKPVVNRLRRLREQRLR